MSDDRVDWAGTTHRSVNIDLDQRGVAGCVVWTRRPGGRLEHTRNYVVGSAGDDLATIFERAARVAARVWWGHDDVSTALGAVVAPGGLTGSDLDGDQLPLPLDERP